ncbi:MAG: LPS-assembly protein LptD [Tidjanibacter sp.]|nr:LPS-assembly protein LptD [Tidjanibacter sp.]
MALLCVTTLGAQTLPTGENFVRPTADSLHSMGASRANEELLHRAENRTIDSLLVLPADTAGKRKQRNFLDEVIDGKNKDSLYYDVRGKMVHIYEQGDVTYGNMNIKADYMRVSMEDKEILAYGKADTSAYGHTRPEFTEAGSTYTMDTVTYNINTKKAKIKGVVTKDGEGYLTGKEVKMMADKSFNIKGGVYTTCEDTNHPHFFISMSKAKFIPGKKIVSGPLYLVIADVPLPVMIPEIFFPMNMERKTGFIMPSYGEENLRGFYLKNGGYYFHINDYLDFKITGGIYTLGSWEINASSSYRVRYKFNGSLGFNYAKTISGDKGSADYVNQSNIRLTWTHSQDAKFNPNSTFSANVNFSTPGYNKNASNNLTDYLSAQTTSSIAYSHSWKGTPISMSANLNYSQNFNTGAVSLGLPNMNFNVSRFFPFKRKVMVGKERWYEKIAMTYKAQLQNSISTTYDELMKPETLGQFKNGVKHTLPVSASFNILGFINLSPSVNYNERWYFRRINQNWDPEAGAIVQDTTRGFYRVYDYSASVSANTTLYGMYQFKNPESWLKAVRHTINLSASASVSPDFGSEKYGYWKTIQANEDGTRTKRYSPYSSEMYGVPGSGKSASLSLSVDQTLEAKIASDQDTTGVKKVKIIDNFSFSLNYNFLADSMKLSTIPVRIRSNIIKNFGINLSMTLDPYEVDKTTGLRYDKLMWRRGLPGRIASTGWSCGYTFRSSDLYTEATINDISKQYPEYSNPYFYDPNDPLDPALRRQLMTSQYYDFSMPWNFSFNYSINYTNNGVKPKIVNTLGFNGSLTLDKDKKWAITYTGGYDFDNKELTPGVVTLVRDLHCWQMNFSCVPFGYRKSWSFNISVKSSLLQDLKYEKSSSHYDNMYDD